MKLFRPLFTVLSLILLYACNPDAPLPKDVFRYNESKGISTLDPAFAKSQTIIWPVSQIFNGLVQMNQQTQVEPCIAKSWQISEDRTTYTFKIRNDVFFHKDRCFLDETRKVTASDFVYSLKRLSDPKTASPGAWVMNYVDKDTLNEGFWAVNDSTLVIQLKQAFPGFLGILTMPYCSVVPREAIERYGKDFRNHPVGTGAFYLKKWREGEKLVLRKNPLYFEKDAQGKALPYLEAVAIRFITDKQSEFLEFRKGNIDFISGVHDSYRDELLTPGGKLRKRFKHQIKMSKSPYLNTEYLAFSLESDKIVQDVNFRKAVNFGFDRSKMLKYLRNNIGTPAYQGFVPKGLNSFDADITCFKYNRDSALFYLQQSAYNKEPISLSTTSDYVDLCEYIQHELKEIGIDIRVEVSSGAIFRDQVASSKLDFFRGSWIADYPDAENYLSLFYSQNFSPSGPNYSHFSSPEFDRLYKASLLENNDSIRVSMNRKMNRIVLNQAPVVPLFYDEVIRFYQSGIYGFETNAMNMLFLKEVYKK